MLAFLAAATTVAMSGSGAAAVAAEPKATTSYTYTSRPGDFIGEGRTGSYKEPGSTFTLHQPEPAIDPGLVRVNVNDGAGVSWDITLAAPHGERLHPGVYREAERADSRTGWAPGLSVHGDGRACSDVYGQFSINQIQTDVSGTVTALDASFTQRCDAPDNPPLTGTVKYRVYPLSYQYSSDPGDWIGSGTSKSYTGSTTRFGLTNNYDGTLTYTVNGKRDDWSIDLAAPKDQTLTAGRTYQSNDTGTNGAATLDASGNAHGCTSTGEFTITRLSVDGEGNVTALAATFIQQCEGSTAALRGTIHYHA
ncbi:hypothetical protein OG520_40545 (plasmid) [Streptomyces sp. NBC_00984]|uniref:hypothetical protein n=1 Tax=Streptomyces sp. NBC_00984 TaxID=2903700 RepID=UPI002F90EF68|nr:hypothetical protein OG520_40545 [Streptomyces sp. NBC_00984]